LNKGGKLGRIWKGFPPNEKNAKKKTSIKRKAGG